MIAVNYMNDSNMIAPSKETFTAIPNCSYDFNNLRLLQYCNPKGLKRTATAMQFSYPFPLGDPIAGNGLTIRKSLSLTI
jgi:hypothetical protein